MCHMNLNFFISYMVAWLSWQLPNKWFANKNERDYLLIWNNNWNWHFWYFYVFTFHSHEYPWNSCLSLVQMWARRCSMRTDYPLEYLLFYDFLIWIHLKQILQTFNDNNNLYHLPTTRCVQCNFILEQQLMSELCLI